jgi:hypothetical protein
MLNNFISSENITSSVNKRLSVFFGNGLANIVGVLFEKVLIFEHVPDTSGYWHLLPSFERILCICDCFVELSLGALGYFGESVLCERTNNINVRSSLAVDPLAVDVVFVYFAELLF